MSSLYIEMSMRRPLILTAFLLLRLLVMAQDKLTGLTFLPGSTDILGYLTESVGGVDSVLLKRKIPLATYVESVTGAMRMHIGEFKTRQN